MFWLSSNNDSVFSCFLGFLFLWRFTGNNQLTSATKHRKVQRFMRGMKQLFCFSWYFCVLGIGWKRKSRQKVPQRSLYLHNKNASLNFSVVKFAAVSCQLNWGRSSPFWRCLWRQAAKWNAGRLSFVLNRNFSFH